MTDSGACLHAHTRLIAKDSGAEYIECLDCGTILDSMERSEKPQQGQGFDESLSDA